MTYGEFLEACRNITGARSGNESLGKSEFSRLLNAENAQHYIRCSNGKGKPGRELLEDAAAQAGLSFEDCISIPVNVPLGSKQEEALKEFKRAFLSSEGTKQALDFAAFRKEMRLKRSKLNK